MAPGFDSGASTGYGIIGMAILLRIFQALWPGIWPYGMRHRQAAGQALGGVIRHTAGFRGRFRLIAFAPIRGCRPLFLPAICRLMLRSCLPPRRCAFAITPDHSARCHYQRRFPFPLAARPFAIAATGPHFRLSFIRRRLPQQLLCLSRFAILFAGSSAPAPFRLYQAARAFSHRQAGFAAANILRRHCAPGATARRISRPLLPHRAFV